MAGVAFKVDTREFTETLRRYREISKRDPKKICDTKGFFIARRAVIETPKESRDKIRSDLGRVTFRGRKAVGLKLRTVKRYSRFGLEEEVPLAALIINKRLGKGRGLHGAAMAEAIKMMLGARLRSIAFLKSGWLPAIRTLVALADTRGAPRQERGVAQVGPTAKGSAQPAADNSWRAKTTIVNAAESRRDNRQALIRYRSEETTS